MRSKITSAEAMDLVKEIDANGVGLTSWEIEFVASFIDHPPQRITDRQIEIVQHIHSQKVPK